MQWLIDIIKKDITGIPSGCILLWSGSSVTIPTGYLICDGTNSTPDLRNRFIVGAGSTYQPGNNGGSSNHQHPFNTTGHTHNMASGAAIGGSGGCAMTTESAMDYGMTHLVDSLPPYYALCYIMKT